jgi:hypothetical protein
LFKQKAIFGKRNPAFWVGVVKGSGFLLPVLIYKITNPLTDLVCYLILP